MQKNILELKVTLIGADPQIWRRVLVPEAYSFADLHGVIQDAMGWTDSHLHHFLNRKSVQKGCGIQAHLASDADHRRVR